MTQDRAAEVRKQLRKMVKNDPIAPGFFAWLADYSVNVSTSTVEYAQQEVAYYSDVEVSRADIIRIMQRLHELKLGMFTIGRRGKKSRFDFWSKRAQIGDVALGDSDEIDIQEDPELPTESEIIQAHRILLASALQKPVSAITITITLNAA